MSEKISVIVPAYNAENYIRQCVESICQQTYDHIEIIIVNDGSTDQTAKIMEDLKKADDRIRTYHQSNKGLGHTRDVGISLATGEYIAFIDSDDWVDSNYLEILYRSLKETDSDISIVNFSRFYEDTNKYELLILAKDYYQKVMTPQEWLTYQYGKPTNLSLCFTVAWCKLYKKSLFDNILYHTSDYGEDDATTWKLYLLANRIVYNHTAALVYRVNSGSMTANANLAQVFSAKYVEERLSLLTLLGLDVSHEIEAWKWRAHVNEKAMLEHGDIVGYKDMRLKRQLLEKYKQ